MVKVSTGGRKKKLKAAPRQNRQINGVPQPPVCGDQKDADQKSQCDRGLVDMQPTEVDRYNDSGGSRRHTVANDTAYTPCAAPLYLILMGTRANSNPAAKSPEEWLEKVAPEKTRGTFKLFLGYAPGVGKTYNMLSEAIRRHQRGEDIVIGVVETHGRPRTAELAEQLEKIPRKTIEYKGVVFEEMDLDGIIARHPQIVLIDELAHTNIEGSKHRKALRRCARRARGRYRRVWRR